MLFVACQIALLAGGVDSAAFRITDQAFNHEKDAVKIVKSIVQHKCEEQVEIQKSHCKKIIGNDPSTNVCYVETNVGYFFVMKDMLETVNVVYNRWD